MSGRPDLPEGEEVLMEGSFDPGIWRREAWASAAAVAVFAVIVLLVWASLVALVGLVVLGGALFAVAYGEVRAARTRSWALTARGLYLSDRPPVPIEDIARLRGSASNVRLRLRGRGRGRLVLLGEAQAIALRARLRELMARGTPP